jgi:hypothetical protein
MERIMKRYDIRVRYSFEGTYTVAAEDRDEAKRMVNDDCGLVLGGDIHTTRDDDEVLDWDFCIHPDTRILSLQERGGKGSLPSEAVDFSGRIKELRGDIIDAIRQLLHAHCVKESGDEVQCHSPFELGAKNIDWLHEMYEAVWHQLRETNNVESQIEEP